MQEILEYTQKTLIHRDREFEMPIGATAYTYMEDVDINKHVGGILRLNQIK